MKAVSIRRRRRKVALVSVLVWYLLVAALPSLYAESLKVPYAALSPTYAPLWIAEQAGYFKKYGLDIQPVYISAGSVIVPALLSGQVAIA
ncbi:MAG: hypothetical protein ABIP88_08975, partial [Candidatus Binatia bacterium]